MKNFFFLILSIVLLSACVSDSAEGTASSVKSTMPNNSTVPSNNKITNELADATDNIATKIDKAIPSDDKIDETVDKIAEKAKNIFKKGKKEVTKEIKNTQAKVKEKADKVVSNVSNKSAEIGKKIETKIDETATQISEKVDEVLEEIPDPAEVKIVEPAKKEVEKVENKFNTAPTKDIVTKKVWGKGRKPDHSYFDKLLSKHVSSGGTVNYKGFKAENHLLEDYLSQLQNNPVQSSWSRDEKLAYWINVYNAFTIKLIVDNYPVSSITKLHGGKPWDKKWIKIGDKTYSLNNIENDIIRPEFKEPRIHFAVNCAAKSCPPLSNSAWTPANMESKFEKATKAFINNSQYNKIDKKKASVSKIFEWYGEDFGDLKTFLNKYADTPLGDKAKISFMEYDWKLNE